MQDINDIFKHTFSTINHINNGIFFFKFQLTDETNHICEVLTWTQECNFSDHFENVKYNYRYNDNKLSSVVFIKSCEQKSYYFRSLGSQIRWSFSIKDEKYILNIYGDEFYVTFELTKLQEIDQNCNKHIRSGYFKNENII